MVEYFKRYFFNGIFYRRYWEIEYVFEDRFIKFVLIDFIWLFFVRIEKS